MGSEHDLLSVFEAAPSRTPGEVAPDFGLQVAVEPCRSHPEQVSGYVKELQALKRIYYVKLRELWQKHGGPLQTPQEAEYDLIDLFLGQSVTLRAKFEQACKAQKARVFGGVHEEDLDIGEADAGRAEPGGDAADA